MIIRSSSIKLKPRWVYARISAVAVGIVRATGIASGYLCPPGRFFAGQIEKKNADSAKNENVTCCLVHNVTDG